MAAKRSKPPFRAPAPSRTSCWIACASWNAPPDWAAATRPRSRRLKTRSASWPAGFTRPSAMSAPSSTISRTRKNSRRDTGGKIHPQAHRADRRTERRLTGEQRDLRERLDQEAQRAGDLRSGLEDQAARCKAASSPRKAPPTAPPKRLVQSQERLDARLRTLESSPAAGTEDINRRFDTLGRELAALIHSTREDCAQRVAEVARTGVDGQRMERASGSRRSAPGPG
jgi:hypothetical protein